MVQFNAISGGKNSFDDLYLSKNQYLHIVSNKFLCKCTAFGQGKGLLTFSDFEYDDLAII